MILSNRKKGYAQTFNFMSVQAAGCEQTAGKKGKIKEAGSEATEVVP